MLDNIQGVTLLLLSRHDLGDQLGMLSSTSHSSGANAVLENNKLRRHYFILATSLSDVTSAGLFSKTERRNWSPCSRVIQIVFYPGNTETKLFLATTKMEDSSNQYGQSSSIYPCVSVYLACPT